MDIIIYLGSRMVTGGIYLFPHDRGSSATLDGHPDALVYLLNALVVIQHSNRSCGRQAKRRRLYF